MSKNLFSSFDIIGRNMNVYLEKNMPLLELDTTLLITGETGTGKELMARWVHFNDKTRESQPFVKITIPNIGENIFESEVFGYEKGAFTGAVSAKKGLVEVAEAGTVFIDEIENATPSVQGKLLQLLEDKLYRKVGSTEYVYSEARYVIATNVDLYQEVLKGNFRSDLYYRLAVLEIRLPSLNERGKDILDIANHYIDKLNKTLKRNIKHLDNRHLEQLLQYKWTGNIRELKNFIERSMVFCQNDTIDIDILKKKAISGVEDINFKYKDYMNIKEREYLEYMFRATSGKIDEMAGRMDMSVPFVYKKIKEHEIK